MYCASGIVCSQPRDFIRLSSRFTDDSNNRILIKTLKEIRINDISVQNKWEENIIENFEIDKDSKKEFQVYSPIEFSVFIIKYINKIILMSILNIKIITTIGREINSENVKVYMGFDNMVLSLSGEISKFSLINYNFLRFYISSYSSL